MPDQAVKPKLQCVMMDPTFSMVTIQSEDSGITWETSSTRCSSPWASEASTISEAYSTAGSGTAGRIIFIMDEDKIHRRKRKTSRKSKRDEKWKISTSIPAIAEGEERPAMTEVSVPNIKPQGTDESGEDPKEAKEQSLFNIVSEGYEILNIIVPSKLPTVDEEESTEMADNLSYLEESQMIKSNPPSEEAVTVTPTSEINILGEAKVEEDEKSLYQKEPAKPNPPLSLQSPVSKPVGKDATSDTDYFEKFTLLDQHIPGELPSGGAEENILSKVSEGEETLDNKEQSKGAITTSKDLEAAVAAGDVEIESNHLDEVFYGSGSHDEPDDSSASKNLSGGEQEEQATDEEPPKSPLKESGSALFGSQETILTPIFLSPGPPKIIDPSLLDEPRAMSFLYTDLYEEAIGERKRGEEFSDVESTVSEKSLHRRLSDTDEANGYFEKFILKDETPVVEDEPITEDSKEDGLRMWPQSPLDLMGFLTNAQEEVAEDTKTEEVIENFLAPIEETEEMIVTSESQDLDDDVFLPQAEEDKIQEEDRKETERAVTQHLQSSETQGKTKGTSEDIVTDNKIIRGKTEESAVAQDSENIQTETATDNEKSKDKPEVKTVVAETKGKETINERKMSEFGPKKVSLKRKDEHISKHAPSVHIDTKCPVTEAKPREDLTVQKTLMTKAKHTDSSDKSTETKRLKETQADIIHNKDDSDVQHILGFGTAKLQSMAHRSAVSKRESTMLRLSPLIPAEDVQEEEQKVEEDSLPQENSPSSPVEDVSDYDKEPYFSEPEPSLGAIEDIGTAEALDYEVVNEAEVPDFQASETEPAKDNEAVELPEQGFDIVEAPNQDSPPQEAAKADSEVNEGLDGTSSSETEQEQKNSKKSRFDFCVVCRCVISSSSTPFSEHKDHEVSTVDKAYYDIKSKLSKQISVLQGRSEKIEDLVSELELAFNSVEENCKNNTRSLDEQNEEMVRMVVDQYNEMCRAMGERKKSKLEQLYGQIGTFQERIEYARETLEKKAKEVEESDHLFFVSSSNDINKSLSTALECTLSLEPALKNHAKNSAGSGHEKVISVPQKPLLLAQEANSATCTSVTVYWRVNEGDVIDFFQVYCTEESESATSEEFKVTVKESYCTLEELKPDSSYAVWVMAVNYTGCSLPSKKLSFRTAPSVPVISTEQCTVCWDSAIIRWSSGWPDAVESYTLEYCRQYACEGEGLRTISGIRHCEQSVLLQPNENYLFYIKAVNFAGASEQSEATLISTTGTRFHLLEDSASPALELSKDNVVHYSEETFSTRASPDECPWIRGELLPPRGYHYWETTVEGCEAYRIGVAYHTALQDSRLGENSMSWCIHCVPTSTSCRFELLHSGMQTDVFTVEVPMRIGTLLDYLHGQLSFFNAQSGQLLGSSSHRFTEPCHPVLVLESPGTLALNAATEVPDFAQHC